MLLKSLQVYHQSTKCASNLHNSSCTRSIYSHSRRIVPVCGRCKTKTNPPHADISAEIKKRSPSKQQPQCIFVLFYALFLTASVRTPSKRRCPKTPPPRRPDILCKGLPRSDCKTSRRRAPALCSRGKRSSPAPPLLPHRLP